MKDEELIKRMMALTERWDWFKENIHDLKKDSMIKYLLDHQVIRDIHAGKAITEKMVSDLEKLTDQLEKKYKPADASILDHIRKMFIRF